MKARRFLIILSLALMLPALLGGCSGTRQISYTSATDAFEKGLDEYEAEDYDRAIEYFRAVFSYGRYNEWAADAQLYIARAYRNQGQYLLAATEYGRFIELYGSDERAAQAAFERALSYYRLSKPFHLDQEETRQAITYFDLFIQRHPQHELVPEAAGYIEELQEKLAHKQYDAAQHYEGRDMWEAAAQYYERVFNLYPQTSWADEALLGAVRAYVEYSERSIEARQAERLREAIENYNVLAQTFPESTLLDEAEDWYEVAVQRLRALEPARASR